MKNIVRYWPLRVIFTLGVALTVLTSAASVWAANHREAPITALDHKADITDLFAFRSYTDPTKVTFILNVDPFQEPSNGPNYSPFDPEILYAIKIDNNNDAVEDITFEFRFTTEILLPRLFSSIVGVGTAGLFAPSNSPPPVAPGTPIIPPAVTALDGPGSTGLGLRQKYTVTKVENGVRTNLTGGQQLFTVPANVGQRTMPNYPALARLGTYTLINGIRVFAGTAADSFYIDLGAMFDTLNFRAVGSTLPGVLSVLQDTNDGQNFAPNDQAGFNVNAIVVEVPIAMLTRDGQPHAADDPLAVLGIYATTSRPRIKVPPSQPGGPATLSSIFTQIQRMGNPFINELLIGTGDKDKFSMDLPKNDAQFANYLLDPLLARVLNAAYGGSVAIPTPPRTDLLPLMQYLPPIAPPGTPPGPIADLLRLNTGVLSTPSGSRSRLGQLAGDAAGYPNGRRVSDDVTDITLRLVVGVLLGSFNVFPNNRIGDGVNNNNCSAYQETFPYVGLANSGRDSRHIDPNENCVGCAPN